MISVLICDDDAVSRHLVKRAVTKKFNAQVFEAADGLEALEILQKEPVNLVVLDLEMPLMSGLDVVRSMRRSPAFASIPVVIISGNKDSATVLEAVRLHVGDFVAKPVDPDVLTGRLTRIVTALNERALTPKRASGSVGLNATALLADGDAEFREYFKGIAGSRCVLSEADTGSRALRTCLKTPPDVLFVGNELGLMGAEELVAQMRAIRTKAIRIIAIPLKSEAQSVRDTGLYDDVLLRSYDPAKFEKEIARLLRPLAPFELLTEHVPNIRTRLLRAAEQVFGKMLSTDVEPTAAPTDSTGAVASAAVTITTSAFLATLRVRFDMDSGRHLAGAFLESDPSGLADDDILSVAGELANVLAGRLHAAFEEIKLESAIGLPALAIEAGDQRAPVDEGALDQYFRAVDKPVTFELDLAVGAVATAEDAPTIDEESGVAMLRTDA